jgi:crotonobetainyl-CoA:carnitine CoA-transferase CaiB-like acyl-CoA transferase
MAIASASPAVGPLMGLSVVELGDGTAGPYAAKMLGDFGAEVVKVETPDGDSSRRRGPYPDGKPDPEASGLYLYLNINKLGVSLDIRTASGRVAIDRLLSTADIFISNLPAETLRRFDLEPSVLRKRYPQLIVTTISPFGSTGPWADRKGDELVTYAMSGMAYSTPGMPDASDDLERELPLHPAAFAAETIAGLTAATATLAAVFGRYQTQEGCHVEVSQQAAVASMQIRDITTASYTGERYNRLLNPSTIGRMPNFYLPCKDGYVTVAAPMVVHWERLVEAMGSPEWAHSPHYADGAARTSNWVALRLKLIDWTITLTGDELHALAEKNELPMFPFYSIRKLAGSDQVRERRSLVDVNIGGRQARMPGAPFSMRATPWQLRRPAPRLGEHNDLVLAEREAAAS